MGKYDTAKWGCPECGAHGEVTQVPGISLMQTMQSNIPAEHRRMSPKCTIERPPAGDVAYESAKSVMEARKRR